MCEILAIYTGCVSKLWRSLSFIHPKENHSKQANTYQFEQQRTFGVHNGKFIFRRKPSKIKCIRMLNANVYITKLNSDEACTFL